MKDALTAAQVNKNTVGHELVELEMSLLPPGFVKRGFPDKLPTHKLHSFGDSNLCVHESYEASAEGSKKVRCSRNVAADRQNGYLCVEHQKALDRRKDLPKDSTYRFSEFDRTQLELTDYLLGTEEREIQLSLVAGQVFHIASSKDHGDLIVIEPINLVF
jgi:hypothetical protein